MTRPAAAGQEAGTPAGIGDLDRVGGWLAPRVGGLAGPLRAGLVAGGRSNPTYSLSDGERSWVLRRPPLGHVLETAHDMGREHRVLAALVDSDVPVPRTVGLCRDPEVLGADFYVMERLEGLTLRTRDDTARLAEADRARLAEAMVDVLVALHAVDPAEVGLADFGRPDGFLSRQLRRWRKQWEASRTRPRPEVDDLLLRLERSLPASPAPGIVHGDFKVDNLMVGADDPARVVGLLDWEMSTLGDPLTDLGVLCSFWDHEGEFHNPITQGATALPGFPRREELVARYAEARGVDVGALDWYLVLADVKIAVILEGIHARHLQGHGTGEDVSDVGAMVDPLLERARSVAAGSADVRLRG